MNQPRNKYGKFVKINCDDPHCDGNLVYEPLKVGSKWVRQYWRCDGLTYSTFSDMLFACGRDLQGPLIN